METVKSDEYGLGSIDFNKLIPMLPELDIEEGSQTNRGLKAYKEFIEVYTFNGKKENFDLLTATRTASILTVSPCAGEDEYHNGSLRGEYRPAQQEALNFANSLWGFDGMEEDTDFSQNYLSY